MQIVIPPCPGHFTKDFSTHMQHALHFESHRKYSNSIETNHHGRTAILTKLRALT